MKVFQLHDCLFFVNKHLVDSFERKLSLPQRGQFELVRLADYVISVGGRTVIKSRYPLDKLLAIALPIYLNTELHYENQKVQRLLVQPVQSLNNPAQLEFDFG